MKPILLSLCLSLALAFPLAPRAADAQDAAIQGTWYLSGQVKQEDGRPGLSWFLEWNFDKGKFYLNGYPPLHQEGSYRIIKRNGNKLTLELYNQQGNFGTDNSQIEIVTGKDPNKLRIKGQGPFKRTKAKQ